MSTKCQRDTTCAVKHVFHSDKPLFPLPTAQLLRILRLKVSANWHGCSNLLWASPHKKSLRSGGWLGVGGRTAQFQSRTEDNFTRSLWASFVGNKIKAGSSATEVAPELMCGQVVLMKRQGIVKPTCPLMGTLCLSGFSARDQGKSISEIHTIHFSC